MLKHEILPYMESRLNHIGKDRSMSRIQIYSPGPSLNRSPYNFLPDLSVCVNGAILHGLYPTFWVINDPEVLHTCFDLMSYTDITNVICTTTLFTHDNLENAGVNGNIWTSFDHNYYKLLNKIIWDKDHWENFRIEPGLPWRHYSLFCAIGLCIELGLTQIDIFGADMQGEGYYMRGLENSRTRHTEKRWKEERHYYDLIVNRCRHEGITIERHINAEE